MTKKMRGHSQKKIAKKIEKIVVGVGVVGA